MLVYLPSVIKAILFDFNGVLVDTDRLDCRAVEFACRELGLSFQRKLYDLYFGGRTLGEGFSNFLNETKQEGEVGRLICLKKIFDRDYQSELIVYPDSRRFLELVKDDYLLGVVSGTRRHLVERAMSTLGWQNYFGVVVTAEDYLKGKPDPEPYLKAMQKLSLKRSEVLVIEDHPLGVESALKAGIKCLAVTHTHGKVALSRADMVVTKLEENLLSNIRGL